MWLAPQEIEDDILVINNKAYVLYLPDTSPISPLISSITHDIKYKTR